MGIFLDEILTLTYVIAVFLLAKNTVSITNKLLTGASIAGEMIGMGAKSVMGAALAVTGLAGAAVGTAGGAAAMSGMLAKSGLANTAMGAALNAGSTTGEMVSAALANAKPAAAEKLPSLPAGFGGVSSAIGQARPDEAMSASSTTTETEGTDGTIPSSEGAVQKHGTLGGHAGASGAQGGSARSKQAQSSVFRSESNMTKGTQQNSSSLREASSLREGNSLSETGAPFALAGVSALSGLEPHPSAMAQEIKRNRNALRDANDTTISTWAQERGFKPNLTSPRLTPEGIAQQSRDFLYGLHTKRPLSPEAMAGKSEAFLSGHNTVFPPPVTSQDGESIQTAKSYGWRPRTEGQDDREIATQARQFLSDKVVRETASMQKWNRPIGSDDQGATEQAREFLRNGPVRYDAGEIIENASPPELTKWASNRGWTPDPREAGKPVDEKAESARDYLRGLHSKQPLAQAQLSSTSDAFQRGHNQVFPEPVHGDDAQVIKAAEARGWSAETYSSSASSFSAGSSSAISSSASKADLAQSARHYISNQAVIANAQSQNWTPAPNVAFEVNAERAREHIRTGGVDAGSRIVVMAAAQKSREASLAKQSISVRIDPAKPARSSDTDSAGALPLILPGDGNESGPPPPPRTAVGGNLRQATGGGESNASGPRKAQKQISNEIAEALRKMNQETLAKAAAEAQKSRGAKPRSKNSH